MTPMYRLWSPRALAGMAFLFSALPAILLAALNYRRLGQSTKALRVLAIGLPLYGVFLVGTWMLPADVPAAAFQGVHVGTAALFFALQKREWEAHEAAGGEAASLVAPVVGGLFLLVALIGVPLTVGLMDDQAFDEAMQQLEVGDYASAAPTFRAYGERWDDPAAWCNLALCEHQLGNQQAALDALRTCQELDPPFETTTVERIVQGEH